MSNNSAWQCDCNCWDRQEHAHRVEYLGTKAIQMQPKWFATARDAVTGEVIEGRLGVHSQEAWELFDILRGKHRGGYDSNFVAYGVDVTVGFDGCVEKSSIWS